LYDDRLVTSIAMKIVHGNRAPSFFIFLISILLSVTPVHGEPKSGPGVPILLYHRFGPVAADSMTVTTALFESHLCFLKEKGYAITPLRDLVDYRLGKRASLPPQSVVIVADDGHKSVFTELLPLLRKHRFPVTLFLYPSAISHASYAMTWDEVRELKKTGLVDIQCHTFWHPDFRKDRKRLPPAEYDRFVALQIYRSREVLEKQLDIRIDMLAWPFGIYDADLLKRAAEAGYTAGFSIERHHVNGVDAMMALPRYLMTNRDKEKEFARIVAGPARGGG
jgi:peptidoglycan/xylan/chitin deacetylase (PgdA/CDA1 family)